MNWVVEEAEKFRRKFGGRDIFETAENSGVKLWYRSFERLKGFFVVSNGIKYIVLNDALDEITRRVVCAHELGHSVLHPELSDGGIRDNTAFLDTDKTEREANIFAAHLLIPDGEILGAMEYCGDIKSLSAELSVPPEMIKYKLFALKEKGLEINASLGDIKNNFLK